MVPCQYQNNEPPKWNIERTYSIKKYTPRKPNLSLINFPDSLHIFSTLDITVSSCLFNRNRDYGQSGQGWDGSLFPNPAQPFLTHGDRHM